MLKLKSVAPRTPRKIATDDISPASVSMLERLSASGLMLLIFRSRAGKAGASAPGWPPSSLRSQRRPRPRDPCVPTPRRAMRSTPPRALPREAPARPRVWLTGDRVERRLERERLRPNRPPDDDAEVD